VGRTAELLGQMRPPAAVPDDDIREALEAPWGSAAVSTGNARRGGVVVAPGVIAAPNGHHAETGT
jgi:hypothetical protein